MKSSDTGSTDAVKTIIITGANGNLGTVVTNHFLFLGYKIIATIHNKEALKEFPVNKNIFPEVVNLANEEETAAFVKKTIDTHKKIDAVLLLAGGFSMGNISDTRSADIKKLLSLNFETAYNIVQPIYQHMLRENKGRIVFIGARPSLKAADGKNMIAYGLSKSLLFKLAEYINADAKGKNITATVVVPSTIDTEPNRKSMPDADPANWVTAEALAEIFEFIVSDKSSPLRETVLKVYNNA